MIEILGKLIDLYLVPILKFVGVYIDPDTCELKPANLADKSIIFKYEGKDVVVVKTEGQFNKFKDKKDEYEIFNPFVVPRHMVFLANLMRNRLNELVEPVGNKNVPMVYDEDLDEWIVKDEKISIEDIELYDKIGVFQSKADSGLVEVTFSYIDKSGNSVQPFVKFEAIEPIMAMYGATLEAMKQFIKILPPHLRDTEEAGNSVYTLLSSYERARAKREKVLTGYQGLDLTHDDGIYEDLTKWDNIEFRVEINNVHKYISRPRSYTLHRFILESPFSELQNIPNIYDYFYLPELRIVKEESSTLNVLESDHSQYDDLVLY